jgi:hypothetical protein
MYRRKKSLFFSSESFSKRYEGYFNNENFSDLIIKFEESQNKIFAHKLVLMQNSGYFQKVLEEYEEKEILIEKEVNEKVFVEFLKFLYSGKIDVSDFDMVFKILGLAHKVK